MNPLAARARLLEMEAELQRAMLGVTLAQIQQQARPLRSLGVTVLAVGGWLLRRRLAHGVSARLLGKLWTTLR